MIRSQHHSTAARRFSIRQGLLLTGSCGLSLSLMASADAKPNRASRRAKTTKSAPKRIAPAAVPNVKEQQARVAIERGKQLEGQDVSALAEQQFEAAAKLAPTSLAINREIARFYVRQQNWDSASSAWRQVLFLLGDKRDDEAATQFASAQNHKLSSRAKSVVQLGQDLANPTVGNSPSGRTALAQMAPNAGMPTLPNETVGVVPADPGGEPTDIAPTDTAPIEAPPANDFADPAPVEAFPMAPTTDFGAPTETMPMAPAPTATIQVPPIRVPREELPRIVSTNVSAIPFAPPAKKATGKSKATAAKAWPFVNQAAKALDAKQYPKAIALYRRAYALDPANPYAGPGIGTVEIILGRFANAAKTYRAFLAYKPNDTKGLRGLADALTFNKNYREALGVNDYILKRDSKDYIAAYQNAQIGTFVSNYDLADRYFNKAISANDRQANIWAAWGESLSYRRDARAVSTFQRALSLAKGDLPRASLGLADYYRYVGQFEQAIPLYRQGLRTANTNVAGWVGLGNSLLYSDRLEEAVSPFRRALQLDPKNTEARLGLGRALVYANRNEEGATELRRVLAVQPNNTDALETLALAQGESSPKLAIATYENLLRTQTAPAARAQTLAAIGDLKSGNNDLSGAIAAYNSARQVAPNDSKIANRYAQLLVSNENYDQAKPVVESTLAVEPNNVQALALQVLIENKVGNLETAQALARRLTSITPASPEEALQLVDALNITGNKEGAKTVLQNAAQSVGANSPVARRFGESARDTGDYATAEVIFRNILAAKPNNTDVRLDLAETLMFDRQLDAAQQEISAVLVNDPNNGRARVLSGQISFSSNTEAGRAEAGRQADAILATDPNNPYALMLKGQVLTASQKFGDAVAQYQQALTANPNNLEARLGLARNLYYSRKVDDSIEQYQQLIRLAPTDTLPRLELAQIYLDRNRLSDAELLYNQVLALSRGNLPPQSLSLRNRATTRANAKVNPLARRQEKNAPSLRANSYLSTGLKGVRLAQAMEASPGSLAPGTPSSSLPTAPLAPQTSVGNSPDQPNFQPNPQPLAPPASLPPLPGEFGAQDGTVPPDFSQIQESASDQVSALRGLGEVRRRQQRYEESVDLFQQALQIDATDSPSRLGLAQALRGQSNYVLALQQVDRVLALEPTNLPARVLRAQLLGDTGKPQQAQTELDNLVSTLPEDAPVETYLTLAQAFNELRNYNASLQLLTVARQTFPGEPAVPRLSAETLTAARRFDDALAIYDQIIVLDPQNADAVFGKARVYNFSDQLGLAQATYQQVLTLEPENYQAKTELADVLARRSNYPAAIALYQEAIAANPTDLTTRVELARVQRYALNYSDAEATLDAILQDDPRSVAAYTERGILRGVQGLYEPAFTDLQQARTIAPTDLTAQLALAEVQGYAGNYEESIKNYRAGLVRDPQNTKARIELGQVLSYSGKTDEALKELNTVIVANPSNVSAQLAKADVLARAERTTEAVNIYNVVLRADPNNRRARTGLADAYLFGSQFDNAVRVYDQLIRLEPTNSAYKIQRARALGYGGKSKDAAAALRSIIAAEPNNAAARLALAEVGTNSGDPKLRTEAIAQYRTILQSEPSNVPARVGLGRVLSYQGNYKAAQTELNSVLAANPDNTEARLALAESQRFSGNNFDARESYKRVLETTPNDTTALEGNRIARRATSNIFTFSGNRYSDSNDVTVTGITFGPTFVTRAGVIGILAERGKFKQGPVERDRKALSLLLARAFGPVQARLVLTRLQYEGAPDKTLFDFGLDRGLGSRQRYGVGIGRRDVFESDAAVAQGITATQYRAGFAQPLGDHIDLELGATYYRYSDDNKRLSLRPAVYYRLKPTNPTFRVGVGYTYDNTDQLRTIYYTPQNYRAASLLADYVVDSGRFRYGLFGAKALQDSTGTGGINRPADTLFGFANYDLSDTFELFAEGGIVRTPTFRSNQINGGVNLRF